MKSSLKAWTASLFMLALSACSESTTSSSNNEQSVVEPTAATTETLYVASTRAACTGLAEQMCLQIRESEDESWQLFYDSIEGFEYQEGYLWELEVQRTEIENPPADASSQQITLVRIIEQTPVDTTLGSIEDIEVAAALGECQSFVGFSYDCLKIRSLGDTQWSTWPGDIEGYEHSEGLSSLLRVQNIAWDDAPVDDTPPFRRVLISVLSIQSD